MNIVSLAHFAGSPHHGMVYGHYYMARERVRAGHDVTIVAASHTHPRFKQPIIRGPITEDHIDGIRYLWLRHAVVHAGQLGWPRPQHADVHGQDLLHPPPD